MDYFGERAEQTIKTKEVPMWKTFYITPRVAVLLKKDRLMSAYKWLIKEQGYSRISIKDMENAIHIPIPEKIKKYTKKDLQEYKQWKKEDTYIREEQKIGDTTVVINRLRSNEPELPILKNSRRTLTAAEEIEKMKIENEKIMAEKKRSDEEWERQRQIMLKNKADKLKKTLEYRAIENAGWAPSPPKTALMEQLLKWMNKQQETTSQTIVEEIRQDPTLEEVQKKELIIQNSFEEFIGDKNQVPEMSDLKQGVFAKGVSEWISVPLAPKKEMTFIPMKLVVPVSPPRAP